jgi:HlyD family secretion protein
MHSGADTSHRAQITIDSAGDAALPDGSHVIPGMTVTAEIKVGRRRLIAYFLSPITKGFSESLREP